MLILVSIIILIIVFSIIYYVFKEPDYRWFIITYRDSSTGEHKISEGGLRCRKKDDIKLMKDEFLKRHSYKGVKPNDIVQIKDVSLDEMRLHLLLKSSDGKQIVLVPW